MAGSILFIVAAASSLSFALTIEQIPAAGVRSMIAFAQHWGSTMFMLLAVLMMMVFGAVLEGAPALIIFGPLLTPIAAQLGINPLHFGTVMVDRDGPGSVRAADRPGPVRHMRHHRHGSEERGAAYAEVSGGAAPSHWWCWCSCPRFRCGCRRGSACRPVRKERTP